jgi:glycosyltransferase involved in cell wall biosynthesis
MSSVGISVVHVITTINLGGAEKQLLTLASCQKRNGLDVKVIFLKDKPELLKDFLKAGIFVDVDFSRLNFYQQIRKLRALKFQYGAVFHAHLPRAELLCALSLRKDSFVVTRHNAEAFMPRGPKLLSRLLSRFVLDRAFASISISFAVASFLRSQSELGTFTRNEIIHYGIKATQTRPVHRELLQSSSIQIGTVSRLVQQKNIPLLLNCLRALDGYGIYNWKMQIVGVGPLHDELKNMASELGLNYSIVWLGQNPKIEEFYQGLDIFVLTSDYEGFGLVLLEAMSQGVPVIARNISAIPEVLGVDHPGLVDSNNANEFASKISILVKNKKIQQNFLDYQRIQLKKFHIEKVEVAHREIYLELLSKQAWNRYEQ